ncbi:MAG TPA: hypothetical protein PKX08_08800, partial [Cyclobacteriaceae bacterium]|nr:hypothetical protein [Cyclobacteriaceae bacterium]
MSSGSSSDKIFSIPTRADWVLAAAKENEGKNPDETLNWKVETIDGGAYYDKSDRPKKVFHLPVSGNEFLGPRTWHNLPQIT